ncbi:hypothetical protein [Mesorhizobium sp. CN2-181]|uniref:hypothetical protein n=1 Tax=Mesorhizobium yinganensis TaxID=3157707 RepID=UPI0032B6FB1D
MIYGKGAVMGLSPQQIDDMSVWQFMAAWDGFVKANDPKAGDELSEDEAAELFEWVTSGD